MGRRISNLMTCPEQQRRGSGLMSPVPFTAWTNQFVRQVLAVHTRFSYFLLRTISASRSGRDDCTATALFPIPFPFKDAWGSLDGCGKKKREVRALQKLVHLSVMALNFENFRQPMTILSLIRRRPSAQHLAVFHRIWTFYKACGPPSQISVAGCGRKSFQLDARFKELENVLDKLGLNSSSQYHKMASGVEVQEDNDAAEELRPYRPLDAHRILLKGTGNWDCTSFLSDLLYMPFVEPEVNRFAVMPPAGAFPDVKDNDPEQVFQLCKVWDAKQLLCLIPAALGPAVDELHLHTRVFGNYKNNQADRQIGDRRGRNYVEGRISPGPSHEIPNATSLLQLETQRFQEVLVGAIADRRDFYHQFSVSYERAATNTVYPLFQLKEMKGTLAYDRFLADFGNRAKKDREQTGDFLGMPKPLLVAHDDDDALVFASFRALFQGDHLGVEFACCAHGQMLEDAGCHPRWNRLAAGSSIVHNKPVTGLVIDDFFCLSAEDIRFAKGAEFNGGSESKKWLERVKDEYRAHGILGSDDKEVSDALVYKVIGAEVNSSENLARTGMVSVGAPGAKRFGLMMLSAHVAGLPYTTDALHSSLVGSWISVLLYRRPMMAHMNGLFRVIEPNQLDPSNSRLRPLPRSAAQELLVLSCLCPLAASNIAVPFSDRIYASDASTLKGGLVSAEIDRSLSRSLWRTAVKKLKNPRLQSRTAALHRIKDDWFEETEDMNVWDEPLPEASRPIGLSYDFIEVCGGAGVVTKQIGLLGFVCGPVLDISFSQRYDITDRRVFAWLAFMCEERRLRSFLAAPPCTTFSPAAFPNLRSYKQPLGYDPSHPRVVHGNDMAFSCIGLLVVAKRTKTPGMMETTRRSKLRWTPQWRRMRDLGADEVHLASCEYGSPHQKEFALLTAVSMNARGLARKCSRSHTHVRIQGKYTKASATYCDGLACALARTFADHILRLSREEEQGALKVSGLEDVMTNEVLLSSEWRVLSGWFWRGSSHINVLETASALRAYEAEAIRGGDLRFVSLIDSHVALCGLARGRSSSAALRGLLKRASCLSLAYGLYQAGRFAPTRWNPADHPTRDTLIPEPLDSFLDGLTEEHWRWIASLAGLRRWSSNWLRLSLLLCPSWISFFTDHSCLRSYGTTLSFDPPVSMDFDSTLGFPGEGPHSRWLVFLCLTSKVFGASRSSHGDAMRRENRRGLELPEGRRVTATTMSVRNQLTAAFNSWLREVGLSYDDVFQANPPDLDRINSVLTRYGKYLFSEGKPYYHFAETINSVSVKRPILRRSLQQAWDLCAMWTSFEPVEHHKAMPVQVLLAVLSTCLIWGWTREAAIFAMCFGMLLRIGELLNAKRADIIFPHDVRFSIDHVLLRILEPKTRFRAARHQSSKLEPPDLILVAWIGLGHLKPHERIWPGSSSTLRSRLDKVLAKLGLPTMTTHLGKPLTLASFRPGGATFLIGLTESAEVVRRKGRWISLRVMDIYLQEVSASTFLTDIDAQTRDRILTAMQHFLDILQISKGFHDARFPEIVWNLLFKYQPFGVESTGQRGKVDAQVPFERHTTFTQSKQAG